MAGTQRRVTLRFLAAPTDANVRGMVDGGKALEWIDKAGYACAVGWAGTYCVTSYVGNVHFNRPVRVGDLVEVDARVVYVGRTSLQVVCTVRSGDVRTEQLDDNTQCLLQFVAMGPDGHPAEVPRWEHEDDWERAENERAVRISELRRRIDAELAEQTYSEHTEACRETLRFLAAPTDVNWGGKVHGGYVMHWIDEAARVVAERWHGGAAVAVYAGGVRFYRPLHIGDLIEVEARLILTGHSSMHITVHVRGGDPRTRRLETTTHCMIVYVALDEHGDKVHVRSWNPRLPEDLELQEHAKRVIDHRSKLLRPDPPRRLS